MHLDHTTVARKNCLGNVVELTKRAIALHLEVGRVLHVEMRDFTQVVIVSGRWEFFDEESFKGARMNELGPGVYLNVKDHGIKDNSISSIRLVSPAAGR